MNTELMEALALLEKEKNINREVMLEAIETSLLTACKSHFKELSDNFTITMDKETCDYHVYVQKEVVQTVENPTEQISLVDAKAIDGSYEIGDVVNEEIKSTEFGRIATQNAKNVILQKIREEEKNVLYDQYYSLAHTVVTGVIQRNVGENISVNLGKIDALLMESEQIKGEYYRPSERMKFYVLEVRPGNRGPRVMVSRTHPELVKQLVESEVSEVRDGIVEIMSIAREAGSRSKLAVWSNDPDVDPVGACVGQNGNRVNTIVKELGGEKIDVICWDENPAIFIQNALSPAKVISVLADEEEVVGKDNKTIKSAKVIVPDYQLSLAIGKEGQNARLAARLTGFKIDIKSESKAREDGEFDEYYDEDGEYYDEDGGYYDEEGNYIPGDEEYADEADTDTQE